MFELNSGTALNRLASSRTPPSSWSVGDTRQRSPADRNAFHSLPVRVGSLSVLLYDTGRPAWRSLSELKVNVPYWLVARSCANPSSRMSASNLRRCGRVADTYDCIAAMFSHVHCRTSLVSPEFPPNARLVDPDVAPGRLDATRTRPSGKRKYGVVRLSE